MQCELLSYCITSQKNDLTGLKTKCIMLFRQMENTTMGQMCSPAGEINLSL